MKLPIKLCCTCGPLCKECAERYEARVAKARAEALEEAARVADARWNEHVKTSNTRATTEEFWLFQDLARESRRCAEAIRALASRAPEPATPPSHKRVASTSPLKRVQHSGPIGPRVDPEVVREGVGAEKAEPREPSEGEVERAAEALRRILSPVCGTIHDPCLGLARAALRAARGNGSAGEGAELADRLLTIAGIYNTWANGGGRRTYAKAEEALYAIGNALGDPFEDAPPAAHDPAAAFAETPRNWNECYDMLVSHRHETGEQFAKSVLRWARERVAGSAPAPSAPDAYDLIAACLYAYNRPYPHVGFNALSEVEQAEWRRHAEGALGDVRAANKSEGGGHGKA